MNDPTTRHDAAFRPNIILINCDDLGYGDLGCYGSQVNQTPHLDRMAAEGMRFTDFYMASPLCSPSRGAMMTGCYPRRISFGTFEGHGVLFPGQGIGLNPDETTIAAILKQQGYATKIVGKWHCGDQPEFLPTRHGFDSYYGLPYSNDMGIQASHLFRLMPPLPLLRDEEVIEEQPDQASLTSRYVEESLRFIRESRDTPFFLYFAHMHVHLPHYVAWRFLKTAINGPYGAAVECIDWSVGVLMRELRRLGLNDTTLMIFTSDNGSRGDRGGSNSPLRGGKFTTWEGGLRVPCIMRWPGAIPAGATDSHIVTSMDFLPTLAHLAGAEPPSDRIIDGKDVRSLLLAEPGANSPHDAFFYYLGDRLQAVRSGPWKLHVWRDGKAVQELYNLAADLGETRDVASEHPDIVRDLDARADAMRQDIGDAARGMSGRNCRPAGRVENSKTLTEYDPEHPYYMAMYDLPDRG
jgi:arylsulfatase A-like enzyme